MLLKDLIEIPTSLAADDFVLKLTEGVQRSEATLRDYVVTPELVTKFDQALGLVQEALGLEVRDSAVRKAKEPESKAAYLHGSFGSGKSHFLAVLHAILTRNPSALQRPELASVVRKHLPWIEGRKFLLVPFHMLGAASLEEKVLGGYVEHVRRLHPDAPSPAVFVSSSLMRSAEQQRQNIGDDDRFLAQLNKKGAKESGWGDLDGDWTLERYHAARSAPPDDREHRELVSVLLDTLLVEFRDVAAGSGGQFVRFSKGLEIISQHAKSLGYDALVFLLDELILWLASHAGNTAFLDREIDKLVNLVEAQEMDRPAPIVAFIARQRDLRQLVSDTMPGVEQLAYADKLRWHEGRFGTIKLEDSDLPTIASHRVLKPRSEEARVSIAKEFERSTKIAQETLDVLVTRRRTVEDFRKTWPFSPALVEVLVEAASMLQRDRTALKAMRELLVERRDDLQLGEIVPVGDLFDILGRGSQAVHPAFQASFDQAQRLWKEKLEPLLEREHNVRMSELRHRPWNDPERTKVRGDERLLKTMLLASLVPGVPCFQGLNARRLSALNHGTIRSPIPGEEARVVAVKLKRWAAEISEIQLGGSESDPTLRLELSGVDVAGILENAKEQDSDRTRAALLKRLVSEELKLEHQEGTYLGDSLEWVWRGTRRTTEVLQSNVAGLTKSSLGYAGEGWKVVVDLPLDLDDQRPEDRRERVSEFLESGSSAWTLIWTPRLLNPATKRDLGRLVCIESALRGDNFKRYAAHIPEDQRALAKNILEGQRTALENRMRSVLHAAYGVGTQGQDGIDSGVQTMDPFVSLDPTFTPRSPVGTTLRVCLEGLLDQAMAHRYPKHPAFDMREPITKAQLRRVLELCRLAVAAPQNRVNVEQRHRAETQGIVVPLELGEMRAIDSPFVLGNAWKQHFLQRQAASRGEWTVGNLRRWIDEPAMRGLPKEIQDLLVLVFAEQSDRVFQAGGVAIPPPELGGLRDEYELREQPLPTVAVWDKAVEAGNAVFGLGQSPGRSASNVAELARKVREKVRESGASVGELVRELERRTPPELAASASRLRTAKALSAWLPRLSESNDLALVASVAAAPIEGTVTAAALGSCLQRAKEVAAALRQANWVLLEGLRTVPEAQQADARSVLEELAAALTQDEYVLRLEPKLRQLETEASKVLTRRVAATPAVTIPVGGAATAPTPASIPPVAPPAPGWRMVGELQREKLDHSAAKKAVDELLQKLAENPKQRVDLSWRLYGPEKSG
jgi:hypothetical protein